MSDLTVIIGADDYLVGEAAKKVVGDGIGLEVVDSLNSGNAEQQIADLRRVEASLSVPPFLDPQKVTWWKNVHFLPSGGNRAVSEEVKEALDRFAEKLVRLDLAENHRFLLTAPALLKTSQFAKAIAGAVTLVSFAAEKGWKADRQAASRVLGFAAEMGLSFAPGVEARFVDVVGADCRTQISELEKLRDYLGEGNSLITGKDVDAVSSPGIGVEAKPWAVTNAIAARDLHKAMDALCKFELENGFEVFMSTVIESQFRRMYDEKRNEAHVHPAWTLVELRVARARFARLRARVVGGLSCGKMLVVTELIRTMRKDAR